MTLGLSEFFFLESLFLTFLGFHNILILSLAFLFFSPTFLKILLSCFEGQGCFGFLLAV